MDLVALTSNPDLLGYSLVFNSFYLVATSLKMVISCYNKKLHLKVAHGVL